MTLGWSAFLNGRRWRLAPLLACALLLGGCEIRLGTKFISVLDDERAVATALSAIESNYKGPIRAVKVVIADDGLLLHAQDPNNSSQISEWRLLREQYSFFDLVSFTTDRVSGPRVVEYLAPNVKLEDRLFDLKGVNLFDWGKVADAAIARAALEDKGGVYTIEIAKPAVLLPGSGGGPVRWSIEVKSERESARIFANAKGEITGANLNGTIRMRGFNMYQRPELAAEAAAEVRSQAGNQPILMRVSFNSAAIAFETNLRDTSYPIAGIRANSVYNWSYNGLQRTMGSADTRSHFSNPEAPFGIDDVDWALLPKIVTDARTALAMPNGRVTSIDVLKPTDGVGAPAPLWKIYIEENQERGEYYADVKGVARTVLPPKSKRKPTAWLDPAVMAQTLSRIASDFGPSGQIVKIFIEGDGGRVIAEESRKPGELFEALLREDGLKRWGKPMFESGKPFPARELEAFTAERITALLARALKELDMPDARLRDITIARDVLGISKLGKVTVALLVLRPNGRQGRVVQALDGTIVEVYKPEPYRP